jgi:hypothetical protein
MTIGTYFLLLISRQGNGGILPQFPLLCPIQIIENVNKAMENPLVVPLKLYTSSESYLRHTFCLSFTIIHY